MVTTDWSTQDVYDVVKASPTAVAAHDKAGWIALFDQGYVIEDPVGSRPVRGDAISGFWDAFIAPNDIAFNVHHDWVDGLHVVRDVTIVTSLATGLQVSTPAHLRYELVDRGGHLKVGGWPRTGSRRRCSPSCRTPARRTSARWRP